MVEIMDGRVGKLSVEHVRYVANKQYIGRAKRAPHWGVQSRFRVIYVSVGMSVIICQINCVGGITCPTRMLKVIFGR